MYLGLPECFSGSKHHMLKFIHERLKTRISGWFSRMLSQGGKEVLLKAVAMAMPIHAMSCLQFPKSSCKAISSAMADFWWNSRENARKIHWKSWKSMCVSKRSGGLGFKDITCFNTALLAKQAWRILQDGSSILARFLKSRYYRSEEFLNATIGSRPSFGWRSIVHGRELLRIGITKHIGNGRSIKVWIDLWINYHPPRPPWRKNILVDFNLTVDRLINQEDGTWKRLVLNEFFFDQDKEKILGLKPVPTEDDYWIWRHNASSLYTVKTGYNIALERDRPQVTQASQEPQALIAMKATVWKVQTEPKIRTLLWKVLSDCLPTQANLQSRRLKIDTTCQVCDAPHESSNHILFTCPLSRQVWAMSNIPHPNSGFDGTSLISNMHHIIHHMKNEDIPIVFRRSIPWLLWRIWKTRNAKIFTGSIYNASITISKSIEDAELWFEAQQIDPCINWEIGLSSSGLSLKWKPPPMGWLKCDIAYAGDKGQNRGGAAWIMREPSGRVILHARTRLTHINNAMDLQIRSLSWAISGMATHHLDRIIFQSEARNLVQAILQPRAWPSLKPETSRLLAGLAHIQWWRLEVGNKESNHTALLIAKSVVEDNRWQSYVARGAPSWLQSVLSAEAQALTL